MPSKKVIYHKINELEKQLKEVKAMFFDHYVMDSQETGSASSVLTEQSPDTYSTKRVMDWDEMIHKTSIRQCLLCEKNLDREFGEGTWHIPLFREHRLLELDKISNSNLNKSEVNSQENKTEQNRTISTDDS